mgnify:FL=1
MDKARAGASSRKPPEPSDSHDQIAEWMRRGVMPDLQPLVTSVDATIRDTLAGLQFAVKWKKAYYGLLDRGWVIELVAYDVSVNVVFLGGAEFDDPPPLGDSARSRYIKLKSIDDLDEVDLPAWVANAGRVAGWS